MKDNEITLLAVPRFLEEEQMNDEITNNITSINAKNFWVQGYKGKGVVVAILDTGCNSHHIDLKDRLIGGYNFTKEFNGDVTIFDDLDGHGTHVAGIIGASFNDTGIVGVAPEVSLLVLKVLESNGVGNVDSLVKAINYAINWRGLNNERVDIISMSLGLRTSKDSLHNAIKQAIKSDIAVVVASGNEGDDNFFTAEYSYPAGYEEVIAVGAVDKNNRVANFSNTNKQVDIYAPGVSIKSTFLNGDFTNLSGTSMAVPHVTGALALLINKYENLTNSRPTESDLFKYLMQHTTRVLIGDYEEAISILNLSIDVGIEDDSSEQFENTLDQSLLLKCFCEARRSQAFFTQCLKENSTEDEREFLISLIQESASAAMHIKNLCQPFK
ncbi:intracellular serine protease [Lysinibacillus mangiferihumi]|uniref:Intracellular serine protease n=1 Tax=Lysinibacillus mangiferihumi TaxID=1130819 RepID=A0A4U2YZ15_9BACI|nr:S8 family peptidase [Lysinibacillus mangiferihumi]TKI66440.1 intracellular serine protease [Lysinibacillus mangiferihumi]